MAAPELAGWITSPSVKETPTLRPKLYPVGGQGDMSKQPSIPESIYSLSNSSDEAVGYFDQHQNTSAQPDLATDSADTFLALIGAERLSRMPHNGSSWDRVLKDAEAFANNVSVYQRMLEQYLPSDSISMTNLWSNARRLLELGNGYAPFLSHVLQLFHTLSRDLSTISSYYDIISFDDQATEQLKTAYLIFQTLVANAATSSSRKTETSPTATNFYQQIGHGLNDFRNVKARFIDAVWDHRIQADTVAEHVGINNRTIHNWLTPQDQFVQSLQSNRLASNRLPESGCIWFEKHLLAFLRGNRKVLLVNGKSGSGKSTLFQWTATRLQRQIAGRWYSTIFCSIDVSMPTESTSVRLLQSLLLQLLDQNVGNMDVFNTLADAYERSQDHVVQAEQDAAAWQALESVLGIVASSRDVVILVDALDGIIGGEPAALEFARHLFEAAATIPKLSIVIMSRPLSLQPTEVVEQFTITPEHTFDDMTRMVEEALDTYTPVQGETSRPAIVQRIVQSGHGSFLWADFVTELLKKENTLDAFLRALDKTPKALPHVLQRLLSPLEASPSGIKSALSWLAISLRPLSLVELQLLAGIDTRKDVLTGTALGSPEDVVRSSGNLLWVDEGVVRFRHSFVQQFVMDMLSQNRMLMPLKDAHRDLALRLLRSVRPESRKFDTTTMDLAQSPSLDEVFRADSLFEYAARYWMVHFYRSTMYKPNGDLALPTDFKRAFPSLVILPIAEGTVWERSPINPDPTKMHQLALKVRLETLNNQSAPVLQSLLNVALVLQRSAHPTEASRYFYQASLLSQTLFGASSSLSMACATSYLDIARRIQITSEPEAASCTEKMLKVLLEASRSQYGGNSEDFIKYQTQLVQLYTDTGNEASTAALDELYDAVIQRYGANSAEASNVSRKFAAALRRSSVKGGENVQYSTKLLSMAQQTLDETDDRRAAATLQMVDAYEAQQDFAKAEELLVDLWSRLTEAYRKSQTPELRDSIFEAAISYIEFLQRHARGPEATSILLGLWSEYEQMQLPLDNNRTQQLAKMLQSTGQPAMALPALMSIWRSYSTRGYQHSDEATSTASSIAQAILDQQDVGNASSSTNESASSTILLSQSQERILREIFDWRLSTTSSDRIDEPTVQMCDRLSRYDLRQNQPAEAISILRGALRLLWPSLMSTETEAAAPTAFLTDAWTLAERLSYCLDIQDRHEKSWPDIIRTCDYLLNSVNVMEGIITPGALKTVQERYTNALSQDKNPNLMALQQAADRYFNICIQYFPLETAMLVQAGFELGQSTERTGADVFETIPIYDKVVQLSQESPVVDDSSIVTTVGKAKDRLAALYRTVALNPSRMPSPMVDTAIAMYFDGYSGAKSQYGPSSPAALDALAELVSLYSRTATEINQLSALQALRETIVDILSSEKSPLRLRESAMALATIYTANGLTKQGLHIVEVLRRQVIFKYAIKEDDFDLSSRPGLDRRSYVFIATLEEGLRASESVGFSSVMSSLLTETLLFESFTNAAPFELKLKYGARLRHFLMDSERYDQASLVENQLIASFAATLDTSVAPSEQNMREFVNRTIEEFEIDSQAGLDKPTLVAGEALTNGHIQQQDFLGSYDIALCAYQLAKSLGSYRDAESIGYGFRLSLYMAGRGVDVSPASEDVQSQMRDLAKTILQDMLDICRQLNIDVARMPLADLKDLAGFLGELQSYAELEWLLSVLWSSHATQKLWSPKDIMWCGKRFVKVRFLHGQRDLAIQLCEDIIYNLTILWGPLDLITLEMSVVLSDLYSAVERYQEAMVIHEDILRQLLSLDPGTSHAEASQIAQKQLWYSKRIEQRAGKLSARSISLDSELLEKIVAEFGGDTIVEDIQTSPHWSVEGSHTEEPSSTVAKQQSIMGGSLYSPRKEYRRYPF